MSLFCNPNLPASKQLDRPINIRKLAQWRAMAQDASKQTKLVTFLGKGGVGKTFSSVIAAQYYASIGLRTCLIVQSQDPTPDFLLGCKLGFSPTSLCNGKLSAFRIESTKLLVEPLKQLKKADSKINFSQGSVNEIVGEELSVLLGMDSLLALGALEKVSRFTGDLLSNAVFSKDEHFDVVIYDGLHTEEVLRMFGLAERARWYINRFRALAERTDIGRVVLPSLLKVLDATIFSDVTNQATRSSAEIWDKVDTILQKTAMSYSDPKKFCSFLVTDAENNLADILAFRYWGCAMQAGIHVAGVFYTNSNVFQTKQDYSPLYASYMPHLRLEASSDWEGVLRNLDDSAKGLLEGNQQSRKLPKAVDFDVSARTIKFFLPGFDKSEVKLSQLRGSELLIEAGDQRRVVTLPVGLRGKVGGAKFEGKTLQVTLKD